MHKMTHAIAVGNAQESSLKRLHQDVKDGLPLSISAGGTRGTIAGSSTLLPCGNGHTACGCCTTHAQQSARACAHTLIEWLITPYSWRASEAQTSSSHCKHHLTYSHMAQRQTQVPTADAVSWLLHVLRNSRHPALVKTRNMQFERCQSSSAYVCLQQMT